MKPQEEKELKCCPLCNKPAELHKYKPNYIWSLGCRDCKLWIQFAGPQDLNASIDRWNTRQGEDVASALWETLVALRMLHDQQNGPPLALHRHEKAWRLAMEMAQKALKKYEPLIPPPSTEEQLKEAIKHLEAMKEIQKNFKAEHKGPLTPFDRVVESAASNVAKLKSLLAGKEKQMLGVNVGTNSQHSAPNVESSDGKENL